MSETVDYTFGYWLVDKKDEFSHHVSIIQTIRKTNFALNQNLPWEHYKINQIAFIYIRFINLHFLFSFIVVANNTDAQPRGSMMNDTASSETSMFYV